MPRGRCQRRNGQRRNGRKGNESMSYERSWVWSHVDASTPIPKKKPAKKQGCSDRCKELYYNQRTRSLRQKVDLLAHKQVQLRRELKYYFGRYTAMAHKLGSVLMVLQEDLEFEEDLMGRILLAINSLNAVPL